MNEATKAGDQPQGSEPSKRAEQKAPSFVSEIRRFIHDVESLEITLPEIARFLRSFAEQQEKQLQSFLDSRSTEKIEDGDGTRYKLPKDAMRTHMKHRKQLAMARRVQQLVPKSFIVTLVSQYDAYLGKLVRLMFFFRPELLNSSERIITFSQLLSFGSIEEAREKIVEKEVESVLRNSHADHFAWLEKKLEIPLRKGLGVWPSFVEVTERRNLFVHCDGVVSTQHLKACDEHAVALDPSCTLGKPLRVNGKYFTRATDTIFEVGVKLGHVIWLKLVPAERDTAEQHLNQLCVELIAREKYELAKVLLEFALGTLLRKESSATVHWMLTINLAQSHKWSGNSDKCKGILQGHDWKRTRISLPPRRVGVTGRFQTLAGDNEEAGAGWRHRQVRLP